MLFSKWILLLPNKLLTLAKIKIFFFWFEKDGKIIISINLFGATMLRIHWHWKWLCCGQLFLLLNYFDRVMIALLDVFFIVLLVYYRKRVNCGTVILLLFRLISGAFIYLVEIALFVLIRILQSRSLYQRALSLVLK